MKKSPNEIKDNNLNLVALPSLPLYLIISFLTPNNIYNSLGMTCKILNKYINSSKYIKQESQKRCLGI